MGNYDQFLSDPNADATPTPSMPAASRYEQFISGAPPAPPVDPNAVDWSKLNQPFGELRPADPKPSETFRQAGQDVLMKFGADPYNARKMSEGANNLAGFTPLGSAIAGADLAYDLPRGNYGHAALDAVGVVPGAMQVRRGVQAARGELPMTRMADTPTIPELQRAKNIDYGRVANAPIDYVPETPQQGFVAAAVPYISGNRGGGFSPQKAPEVHDTLTAFQQAMQQRGGPVWPTDYDTLRSQLTGFPAGTPNAAAGRRAVEALDQYMVDPRTMVRSPPGAVGALERDMQNARAGNRSYKTAETVDNAIDYAGTKNDITHSAGNLDNKTRQALGAFLTSPSGEKKLFGARPDELAAIGDVARGDWLTNKQREFGKNLGGGGGIGQSMLAGGGGAAGYAAGHMLGMDPITTAALGAGAGLATRSLGKALRQGADERTVNAAREVVDQIARNSPLYASRLKKNPDIVDPFAMQRDAMAYALLPQINQSAGNALDEAHTPYANR